MWHELNRTGDKWPIQRRTQLALALAIMLPDKAVPKGVQWKIARTVDSLPAVGKIVASVTGKHSGAATFLKLDCQQLTLKASYRSVEKNKETRSFELVSGGLEADVYWHPQRGHLLGGEVRSWMKLRYRTPPKKGPAERIERYHFSFEMDLVLKLSDARLARLVNKSIADGVKWIKKKQKKDGSWGLYGGKHRLGYNALCLLALLGSGVKPEDPVVVKGFEYLTKQKMTMTYDAALYLMALEAKYSPTPEALHQMTAKQRKRALAQIPKKISKPDRKRIYAATRFLLGDDDYQKRWGYPHTNPKSYDNSNSQYGVLGLLSATRCGVKLPGSLWSNIARFWLAEQDSTGPMVEVQKRRRRKRGKSDFVYTVHAKARGWNYRRPSRGTGGAYGSMTLAGIASLAICRSRLWQAGLLSRKMSTKIDESMQDGLAWMQQHYDLRRNPGKKLSWFYYYLYGLERAGVLAQAPLIGQHNWYREGAALLVTWQRRGAWNANVMESCFALLFLKKATAPLAYSRAR